MANYCDKCGETVNPDDLFCNNCGAQLDRSKTWVGASTATQTPTTSTTPAQATRPKRFYRSREDKWLGGVCGGLGEYFNIDPILIRILFIIFVFSGSLLVYLALLLFVQENPYQQPRTPSK